MARKKPPVAPAPESLVEPASFHSGEALYDPDEPASGGIQQGSNHARREVKETLRGHGGKTHRAHIAQLERRG